MENVKKTINISKPYIVEKDETTREICLITIGDSKHEIFFDVPKKFGKYLIDDRCDAYLIGMIHYALENNYDINCEAPITDQLLYNIKTSLIPTLLKYGYKVNSDDLCINCKTKPIIKKKIGFVGTGLSCGVDSFCSIKKHLKTGDDYFDLDYVVINSVGSFNECYGKIGENRVKEEVFKRANNAAQEMGIELIQTNSNFFEEIHQDHLMTNSFSSIFAIYMLQKLWKIYYLASSGLDYSKFSVFDYDSAHYDLLNTQAFSISNLRIYSDCGEMNRLEKTLYISDFLPAQKYLHVCVHDFNNCNVCSKCNRTLLALFALNKLNNFSNCFDINYFLKNKRKYFKWLYAEHFRKDPMNEPVFKKLYAENKEFKHFVRLYRLVYRLRRFYTRIYKKKK